MPLNYWQIYGNPGHMPDLRTSIVHSTRTSTLNGFGRNWRANNHTFIVRSKLKRKSKGSTPTFRNMSASTYFTKEDLEMLGLLKLCMINIITKLFMVTEKLKNRFKERVYIKYIEILDLLIPRKRCNIIMQHQ